MSNGKLLNNSSHKSQRNVEEACRMLHFARYLTRLHMLQLQAVGGVTFQKVSNGENAQRPIAGWLAGLKMAHGNVLKPTYWEQQNLHKQLIGKMPVSMALFPPARMGGENVDYGYKGKGSLMHLIVDAQGKPLYATLTGANGNERTELPNLLDKLRVTGGMCIIEADKGYDSKAVRLEILNHGYYPLIPYRGNKKGPDKWVVRMRWKVERCFSWLKRSYETVRITV